MTNTKPGFWQWLFGRSKSEPTKTELPAPEPAKKEPPSQEPAPKEPPKRRRVPKTEASGSLPSTTKLKAHPLADPAAAPGTRALDEKQPGTRKRGTPDHAPRTSKRPGSASGRRAAERKRPVPPPHAPHPVPDDASGKIKEEGPAASPSEPPHENDGP